MLTNFELQPTCFFSHPKHQELMVASDVINDLSLNGHTSNKRFISMRVAKKEQFATYIVYEFEN